MALLLLFHPLMTLGLVHIIAHRIAFTNDSRHPRCCRFLNTTGTAAPRAICEIVMFRCDCYNRPQQGSGFSYTLVEARAMGRAIRQRRPLTGAAFSYMCSVVVELQGLEPWTSSMPWKRSSQLSYSPTPNNSNEYSINCDHSTPLKG